MSVYRIRVTRDRSIIYRNLAASWADISFPRTTFSESLNALQDQISSGHPMSL